jgi:anti-sigma factor RsiW
MKMNEMDNSPSCERASELISVLYGETSERERREFELHSQQCSNCRAELAAFAQVRESIRDWRDEALTGFVASPVAPAPARAKKSAIAALRQFFDLSPLWMKVAVGFAAVVFCVLAAVAVMRLGATNEVPQVAIGNPGAVYTQQDVERIVQEALARKEREQRAAEAKEVVVESLPAKDESVTASRRTAKARRPFSKYEREQLAAELRLLSERDSLDLDLLGDQINRQR